VRLWEKTVAEPDIHRRSDSESANRKLSGRYNPTSELITSGLRVTREGRPGMSPILQMFAQNRSEEELRAVCKELFIPQRDHGIDAHGAARRDIASRECDTG
jgi:hypothetical protein